MQEKWPGHFCAVKKPSSPSSNKPTDMIVEPTKNDSSPEIIIDQEIVTLENDSKNSDDNMAVDNDDDDIVIVSESESIYRAALFNLDPPS